MFMKNYQYGELKILKQINDLIEIKQYGTDEFVFKKEPPPSLVKVEIKKGMTECTAKMLSGKYKIIVLDEVIVSIYFQLIETDDLIDLIKQRPEGVELILTGRYCPTEIIELADLVTEMSEVKHYYKRGILSRKGFEC
jgi:cob(I)alamin adenosyltransferase